MAEWDFKWGKSWGLGSEENCGSMYLVARWH